MLSDSAHRFKPIQGIGHLFSLGPFLPQIRDTLQPLFLFLTFSAVFCSEDRNRVFLCMAALHCQLENGVGEER